MPSVLLTESIAVELGASEPWPQDVELYQPQEARQILLPDNANCLAVQTFLKMCGLDFNLRMRPNVEHMSPSGKVPFLRCGAFVIADLEPIVAFVNTKGINLTDHLDGNDKADMRAYMTLVNNVLGNAEQYLSWADPLTYEEVTKNRYSSVYPWPLNHILTWQKRKIVTRKLAASGWLNKSLEEVYADVESCCIALSERLASGKTRYFFGESPTELDALVFGHLFTVLTTPLPDNRLAASLRQFPNLVHMCQLIESTYFEKSDVQTEQTESST